MTRLKHTPRVHLLCTGGLTWLVAYRGKVVGQIIRVGKRYREIGTNEVGFLRLKDAVKKICEKEKS